MASEPERMSAQLNIDLDQLVDDEKIELIEELLETLAYEELLRIRDASAALAAEKKEDARRELAEDFRRQAEEKGMTIEELFGRRSGGTGRRKRSASMEGTYRTPDGIEWYGQGRMPKAFRELLDAGHDIEEFRVRDEE